MKSNRQNK